MLIDNSKENGLVFTQEKDYLVDSVVCDYGIYERQNGYDDKLPVIGGYNYKLKLILNSRANAIEILKILDKDTLEHKRLNKGISL